MENINNIQYIIDKIGFKNIDSTLFTTLAVLLKNNLINLLGEDYTFDIEKNNTIDDDNTKVIGYKLKINSNFDKNQLDVKILPNKQITIYNKNLNKELKVVITSDKEIVMSNKTFEEKEVFNQTIYIRKSNETLPAIYITEQGDNTKTNTIFESNSTAFKTGQEYIMQYYKNIAKDFESNKYYTRYVYGNDSQDIANYCSEIFESLDNFKKKENEKNNTKKKRRKRK